MLRLGSACTWLVVLALGGAAGSPPAPDPDVARGIQQFEDGYYDQAALTLDAAIQRLTGNASATEALQKAYIYLGAACVGLDQREKAKTQFRSAIPLMVVQPGGKRGKIKDLSLASFGFSPKVTEVFAEAQREARAEGGEKDSKPLAILAGTGAVLVGGGAAVLATRSAPPAKDYNLLTNQAIVFVGSDPPLGSTISVGSASSSSPKVVLRVTVSAVAPRSGLFSYTLWGQTDRLGNCIAGGSPPQQVAAGETMTATAELHYPTLPCALPFTIIGINARLGDANCPGNGCVIEGVTFPVSYTFVP